MRLKGSLVLGITFLAITSFGCGGALTKKVTTSFPVGFNNKKEVILQEEEPPYLRGLAKIQEHDCPSCHALESKSVGPSYTAVAAKYEVTEEVVAMLAGRIILGSVGIWGEIPMTAHPDISHEDAGQMVKYVLTLKN